MTLNLPSPEERLHWPLFESRGVEVWIKRDDLIHPLISGNKWRKLALIMNHAMENKVEVLESYGGAWSNHLLALAASAASHGLRSKGFVRGEEVQNPLLSLCRQYGMELEFVNRDIYREIRESFQELELKGNVLRIPEGGNCSLGREGMKCLWEELTQSYDIVLDSVGSGTSVRGLQMSKPDRTNLWGMMAVKDHQLADELEKEGVHILRDYTRGGFAKVDKDMLQISREFTTNTGILLDPVYTVKQWICLLDLIESGKIKRGQRVLFVHSGGLAGWMSNPA